MAAKISTDDLLSPQYKLTLKQLQLQQLTNQLSTITLLQTVLVINYFVCTATVRQSTVLFEY